MSGILDECLLTLQAAGLDWGGSQKTNKFAMFRNLILIFAAILFHKCL